MRKLLARIGSLCAVLALFLVAQQSYAAACSTYYRYDGSGTTWYTTLPTSLTNNRLNVQITYPQNSSSVYICTVSTATKCLNHPGSSGEKWSANGTCDVDSDGDGIVDLLDQCVTADGNLALDTDNDGCDDTNEDDDDGDGVPRATDNCPSGVAGMGDDFDADGCKSGEDADDDNDGMPDATDMCLTADFGLGVDADSDGCDDADEDTDDDNDGVADAADSCVTADRNLAADFDGDGCDDTNEDADDDNDGKPDASDTCLTADFNLSADHDGDGCDDANEDTDDDNDGVADASDSCSSGMLGAGSDFDGDGCKDTEDFDDDNDGKTDALDSCPMGATAGLDTDNDGCKDVEDGDDDNDGIADASDACSAGLMSGSDFDGDGCKDDEDGDDDNDGVPDASDNCATADKNLSADVDGDGCDDANEDLDDDNDGVADATDRCATADNNLSADFDGDGCDDANEDADDDNDRKPDAGDACLTADHALSADGDGDGCDDADEDTDDDNDGVPDATDNCVTADHNLIMDADNDGCDDANEDLDDDNDGVADGIDQCVTADAVLTADFDGDGCDDADEDTDDDNDGMPDATDMCQTADFALSVDADSDGCDDNNEDADDDNDGVADAADKCITLDASLTADVDGDGCDDTDEDQDDDGDGLMDWQDLCPAGSSTLTVDYDHDGCDDATEDNDDDNDGVADASDNCVSPNGLGSDFDGDGCDDANEDTDDDNDGVADTIDWCMTVGGDLSSNRDGDGCNDAEDWDDDGDGVPDGSDACLTGTIGDPWIMGDLDTDWDGCKASEDADDDNDGIKDGSDTCPGTTNWTYTGISGAPASDVGLGFDPASYKDADADGCEDYYGEDMDGVDADGDGVDESGLSPIDQCFTADGDLNFDFDGDGCDKDEDLDDDNDGFVDTVDDCINGTSNIITPALGKVGCDVGDLVDTDSDGLVDSIDSCPLIKPAGTWVDYDGDGCNDTRPVGAEQDHDDDNDGVDDATDACNNGIIGSGFVNTLTDWDSDGCANQEDSDWDGDGVDDGSDACVYSWFTGPLVDVDGDGCDDQWLDPMVDVDGDNVDDRWNDQCPGTVLFSGVDVDHDGCDDLTEDPVIDTDQDGYPDVVDACPQSGWVGMADMDSDGCSDWDDTDTDGDGVDNMFDACTGGTALASDVDGDGCDDATDDLDDDNDGVDDVIDDCQTADLNLSRDQDGDGCDDANEDTDDDNDGVADATDQCWTGDFNLSADLDGDGCDDADQDGFIDSDHDGIQDGMDSCVTADGNLSADADNDGCDDADEDTDDDADGVADAVDNCMTRDRNLLSDVDADGCDDTNEDLDDDNDGVADGIDACVTADYNLSADFDGDGCDDADEDTDDDNDGLLDGSDNCATADGNLSVDVDGDGCDDTDEDLDSDNDGVNDLIDQCYTLDGNLSADADADGCDDADEDTDLDNDGVANGSDLCATADHNLSADLDDDGCDDADEDTDLDNDGVPNGADFCFTTDYNLSADFDGDGCDDADEDTNDDNDLVPDAGDNCLTADAFLTFDVDADGCDDIDEDLDDDNDGILDTYPDTCATGDHNLSVNYDGDGCDDADEDNDDDNDGVPDAADQCQNGTIGIGLAPADGMGLAPLNGDVDGDGCDDLTEDADDDGDTIADPVDKCPDSTAVGGDHDLDGCKDSEDDDQDNDGVPNAADACPMGTIGTGTAPANSDYDGDGCDDVAEDTDDDNDGVADVADTVCTLGTLGTGTGPANSDYDADGCDDDTEDADDDNDGVDDGADVVCPKGVVGTGDAASDVDPDTDGDGCANSEDLDDDNDTVPDDVDTCDLVSNAGAGQTADHDGDGMLDFCDDTDSDNDGVANDQDACALGAEGECSPIGGVLYCAPPIPASDHDGDGCNSDEVAETDADNDGVLDEVDDCNSEFSTPGIDPVPPTSSPVGIKPANIDTDGDGCDDLTEDYKNLSEKTPKADYGPFHGFVAHLAAVLDDDAISGVYVGVMASNSGLPSNDAFRKQGGGTILSGYRLLQKGDANHAKRDLIKLLASVPESATGGLTHQLQPRETFYENILYLNGNNVELGQNTYKNFNAVGEPWVQGIADFDPTIITGDGDPLDREDPAWADGDSDAVVGTYVSPFTGSEKDACAKLFGLVVASNADGADADRDDQIDAHPQLGTATGNDFIDFLNYISSENTDLVNDTLAKGKQNMRVWVASDGKQGKVDSWAKAGKGASSYLDIGAEGGSFAENLRALFAEVLSTSSSFVAASVPVNVYNEVRSLDDFLLAVFEADKKSRWPGNIKKLALEDVKGNGITQILDTVNLDKAKSGDPTYVGAINTTDGRIKHNAVTFWTKVEALPPKNNDKDEVDGADGRSVTRGGAGQRVPQFIEGVIDYSNTLASRQIYTDHKDGNALIEFNPTDDNAADFYSKFVLNVNLFNRPTLDNFVTLLGINTGLPLEDQQKEVVKSIMHYARGVDIQHPDYDRTATSGPARSWIIGDIIHSKPLALNYGNIPDKTGTDGEGWNDTNGSDVKNPYVSIIFGANDGMIHFLENTDADGIETGVEKFAFIPRDVFNILPVLAHNTGLFDNPSGTNNHPYGMDGQVTSMVFDDTDDGDNILDTIQWTDDVGDYAYIYGGMRRGGRNYYALDVTNPHIAPTTLPGGKMSIKNTDADFKELGLTFSNAIPMLVRFDENVTPALMFAGGYDIDKDDKREYAEKDTDNDPSTPPVKVLVDPDNSGREDDTGYFDHTHGNDPDSEGNAIYIVNAITLELIWKATNTGATTNDHYYQPDLDYAIPSTVKSVDSNGDGYTDRMYVGDIAGNVWRGDFPECYEEATSTADAPCADHIKENWKLTKLASFADTTAVGDTRFFHPPAVVFTYDALGNNYDAVVIGSGDRENPLELTDQNRIFMIKDLNTTSGVPPTSTLELADLEDVTDCVVGDESGCPSPGKLSPESLEHGWYINLDTTWNRDKTHLVDGEKAVSSPIVVSGEIFLTTYVPNEKIDGSCVPAEGFSNLFLMDLKDGTAANDNPTRHVELAAGLAGDVTVAGQTIILPGTAPLGFLMSDADAENYKNDAELDGIDPDNYELPNTPSGVESVDYIYWRESDIGDTK